MNRIKIVRTDCEIECPQLDEGLQQLCDELVLLGEDVQADELATAVSDADLLLVCYAGVSDRVLHAAGKLKGIVKYGVGIDAIDIDSTMARRIPVVNVPAYAEETVAEAAFTMMISLAKKLVPMDAAMRSDGWLWPASRWLGSDVAGKTVGLVGVGRIGRSMARMAGTGFRARVLGYDPHVSEASMRDIGVEKYDSLLEMLSACDFVSIHCVLNADTDRLIGRKELEAMKKSAVLINVSRGALIDEQALLQAVREGKIGGVGLDVYSQEPLTRHGHPLSGLFDLPNVILLPHLAFYTNEAISRLTEDVLERCVELLEGRPVTIKSTDPRLRKQTHGVRFCDGRAVADSPVT